MKVWQVIEKSNECSPPPLVYLVDAWYCTIGGKEHRSPVLQLKFPVTLNTFPVTIFGEY